VSSVPRPPGTMRTSSGGAVVKVWGLGEGGVGAGDGGVGEDSGDEGDGCGNGGKY
jgi:hypothetical protein